MNLSVKVLFRQATWISLMLVTPLALIGCQVSISTPNLSPESQAKFYLQAMTKGQQAYYANNGQFANSIEKLSVNVDLETTDYRYSVVSQGENAQSVLMTAAAKTSGLPSYTGVVYVNRRVSGVTALANLCQTATPSMQPPILSPQPNPSRGLECPAGSISVQ